MLWCLGAPALVLVMVAASRWPIATRYTLASVAVAVWIVVVAVW